MADRRDEGASDVEFSGDEFGDDTFVLRFSKSTTTVRDLVVRSVESFVRRQIETGAAVASTSTRTNSPITASQIAAQAAQGAVAARGGPRRIDKAKEVAKALRALRERRIRVFVDSREQLALDSEVSLLPWTKVVFVRALRSE
ncbi:MAG TPA: hypothetical protein VKT51_01910 [Candidatus Eremiobacteraceae bacterium]|nr:hypothetical protein [Candidatus Eremiobacteraceae bacterium]